MNDKETYDEPTKWIDMDHLQKWFYTKICWYQAYSQLALILSVLAFVLQLYSLLLVRGNHMALQASIPLWQYVLGSFVGIMGISAMFLLGHVMIKRKWRQHETGFNNKYNPDIQEIKKGVNRR